MLDLWKKQFNRDKLLMRHGQPRVFFQSQWQNRDGPSTFYLFYKWLMTGYLLGTWLLTVIDPKNLDKSQEFRVKWLIYLTNWGYSICLVQSLICSICLTAWVIHTHRTKDAGNSAWINRSYKLYWICNTIATDIAFGITALYWALIYNSKTMQLDAQNVFVHGTNSVVMFAELCIVKHPTYFVHFYWSIFFGFVYSLFSVIYFASGGTSRNEEPYIYTVLDWRNAGRTTGICFAVLLFIIVLHCFSSCVCLLRIYVHKKFYPSTQYSSNKEKNGIENTAMTDFPA